MEPTIKIPWSLFEKKVVFFETGPVLIICDEVKLDLEPLGADEEWSFDITHDLRLVIEPNEEALSGLLFYVEKDGGEYTGIDIYKIIRAFYKLGIGHPQELSFGTKDENTYIRFE